MGKALVLDGKDNVATLIEPGRAGEMCELKGFGAGQVRLAADIPYGHKVAIRPIAAGGPVLKHGEDIGVASAAIAVGEHVHIHNVESRRGRGDKARAEQARGTPR